MQMRATRLTIRKRQGGSVNETSAWLQESTVCVGGRLCRAESVLINIVLETLNAIVLI